MRTAGFCPPLIDHQSNSSDLRNLLGQARIREILHFGERQCFGTERQRQDGRVGRIGFVVDRRIRKIDGKKRGSGVDGGLNLLLGHIDVQIERELQGDHGAAIGAARGHLVQSRHLSELPFERSGDVRGDYIGTRAGVEGGHLNGRIIHLGKRGDRQLFVGDCAYQQQSDHEQRSRHGPENERA